MLRLWAFLKTYNFVQADIDSCQEPSSGTLADAKARIDQLVNLLNLLDINNLKNVAQGGLIYTLRQSCADAPSWVRAGAEFDDPGFSEHLTAVSLWLIRRTGLDDALLNESAKRLAAKQPENPFFLFLHEGKTDHVLSKIIEHCPADSQSAQSSGKTEWIWEREYDATKWHTQSSLWDCLFIGSLWLKG